MNFFSDERAAEMRELFFESAAELLQLLNDEGLKLEKNPLDKQVLREVRRAVHTLKGDSAACGYQELSELAHLLEDALTPEVAARAKSALADVVLIAADTFSSMLSAYREGMQPPDGEELKQQIGNVTRPANVASAARLQARFAWAEYDQMEIARSLENGEIVYCVAIAIDPHCPMRPAAIQLIRNVLQQCGTIRATSPGEEVPPQEVDVLEVAISSSLDQEIIAKKCRIPSIVSDVLIQTLSQESAPAMQEIVAEPGEDSQSSPLDEITRKQGFAGAENLLRVDAERIDSVMNLLGELIIAKGMLHQTVTEFESQFPSNALKRKFADALGFQARIMNDLQKSVMKIRMVPVEQLFRRFPRIVRDVAKACGKDVELTISGQDTDLDKSILDSLAEPLAHLVRNAIDHGIEPPEERLAAGKHPQGRITLAAYHQGNQIVIEAGDDGRGIDRDALVQKAIQRGLIKQSEAAALSEEEALDLMFRPGLSTAEQVTSISGRGVGMDVVKGVLDRLKGTISVRTNPGHGSTFYLRVPLTLAIIKALLFWVDERMYAVPLSSVVEITRASRCDVHRVEKHDIIRLRDQVIPLIDLHTFNQQTSSSQKIFLVVVAVADRKFALVVDKLAGEEELVIKALDDQLVATDLVSGASVLGDGTVVLILNTASVVARQGHARPAVGASA
ncbi:MAG TPA: chemotaxis protein CheA [Terriglobales bacterium]|nr:chemotaxis protein CheA [Terriglobales bacterium]